MSENLKLAYILKIKRKNKKVTDDEYFYEVFKSKDMAELFRDNYTWAGNDVYLFETLVIDDEWKW